MTMNDDFKKKWDEEIKPKIDYYLTLRYGKITVVSASVVIIGIVFGIIYGTIYQADYPEDDYEWSRYGQGEGVIESILGSEAGKSNLDQSNLEVSESTLAQGEKKEQNGDKRLSVIEDTHASRKETSPGLPVQRSVLGRGGEQEESGEETRSVVIEMYQREHGARWQRELKKDYLFDKEHLPRDQFEKAWEPFGDIVTEVETNQQEQNELIDEIRQESH